MSFLNNLGKTISQTGHGIAQNVKENSQISKLENNIAAERKKIDSIILQIGKLYYELHADSCEDSFVELISQIKACETLISQYTEEIDKVKGFRTCPKCGGKIPLEVKFCNLCGAKIEEPSSATEVETNEKRCAKCNSVLSDNSAFCENCGEPVPDEMTTATKCPACGEDATGSAFCPNCGTKINR